MAPASEVGGSEKETSAKKAPVSADDQQHKRAHNSASAEQAYTELFFSSQVVHTAETKPLGSSRTLRPPTCTFASACTTRAMRAHTLRTRSKRASEPPETGRN
ncbi:hypothetical protein HPB50_016506 [Hyalomma asiaticum]|uniref:Uncharacterized protein n=1 Tax=Hyalomma asiaticum TaxID=266040 RepID=A0ACB7SZC0_HYAAI|nr:hypothetical protein HPB50_016506 [Hyalomma asiaticum]